MAKEKPTTNKKFLEDRFHGLWMVKYPEIKLQREKKLFSNRRHRGDFVHMPSMVIIEIQGGVWGKKSGHNSGTGILKDYEKMCLAQASGYQLFPLAESMITDFYLDLIAKSIKKREIILKTA